MAKIIKLRRHPGKEAAEHKGPRVIMCAGCQIELDIKYGIGGDEIQGIMTQHRTTCTLPALRL